MLATSRLASDGSHALALPVTHWSIPHPRRGNSDHRGMAHPLQRGSPALEPGVQDTVRVSSSTKRCQLFKPLRRPFS